MKISYYELLGMIKDGNAPKQIVHNDNIYIWEDGAKYCKRDYSDDYLSDVFYEIEMLDNCIEIIEESKESDKLKEIQYLEKEQKLFIINKINELVKAVNELKAKE